MGPRSHARTAIRAYVARAMARGKESGQITPLLVILLLATLATGFTAFQAGHAAILKSSAQTAADAAALAAARNISDQLMGQTIGNTRVVTDINDVQDAPARAAAVDYAQRNGGHLTGFERSGTDVKVWVSTDEKLGEEAGRRLRDPALALREGEARARGRVNLVSSYASLPNGQGGAVSGETGSGDPQISDDEWAKFAKTIGHPPRCTGDPATNDVVKLGRFLETHGALVGENDAFANTVDPVHATNSWHYQCNDMGAIDVNFGGDEGAILDRFVEPLHKLGFSTIWRAAGHYDHMHIDAGRGGSIGAGFGGGGAGPFGDTALQVKLIDWDAASQSLGGFGVGGATFGGTPNAGVARTICAVLRRYRASPKVILAAYETAIVESGVQNLPYGDRDSLGVYQQRASWGSTAERMNPEWSATQFVTRAIAGNQSYMSAGQLSQHVQVSAYPDRYDAVAGQAQALANQYCS